MCPLCKVADHRLSRCPRWIVPKKEPLRREARGCNRRCQPACSGREKQGALGGTAASVFLLAE